ncbi:replicative DNA helicase [Aminithiophilus ramosus]|uniref:Replicative DNA helicase n=2 Tax=Synergistales TaxID=649776 RepID=A0A9Q7EWC1_9BACT|nr:replicative DNA helicase [Aminithiophilus ramosus]QTX33143.1 replicative DNA helicase [Aminithiophilus ramosus]QVL37095.1 replicative DNA helicase [Synergistota bacterium]
MAEPLRVPPHNLEAERAVLGASLLDKDGLLFVTETLQTEDFYDLRHRRAFDIMVDLAQKDRPVDPLTFMEEASRKGILDELGGQPFLAELVDSVTTVANVEYHVAIVRDKSVHRRLIQVGSDIVRLGYAEDRDVDEILDEAERAVFEISQRGGKNLFRHVGEVLGPTFRQIEIQFQAGEAVTGVSTGFADFDRLTGGLQPGSLNIVAARPSMGKTALALNIAQYAAVRKKVPVLVFSLEMGAEQLVQRLLGAEARINIHDLRTGSFHETAWESLAEAAGVLAQAPLYIDDSSVLSTLELRARCRRFKALYPELGLVVVDYLQLMSMAKRVESKQQEVAEISRALKAVARELEVPVVALSQLSRAVESRNDKRPMLSDLRDSGAIEQDADLVILLYRGGYYNATTAEETDNAAEIIVAKHRNGPTGTVHLVFLREFARFVNADQIYSRR